MSSKRNLLVILVVSVVLLLVGIVTLYPDSIGVCGPQDRGCIYPLAFNLGEPLTFSMILFIPSVLLVLVFRNTVYGAWKKFALVYVPLAVLAIILVPVTCSRMIDVFCFTKENTSWLTAGGFLLITLLLVASQKLKETRVRKQPL